MALTVMQFIAQTKKDQNWVPWRNIELSCAYKVVWKGTYPNEHQHVNVLFCVIHYKWTLNIDGNNFVVVTSGICGCITLLMINILGILLLALYL